MTDQKETAGGVRMQTAPKAAPGEPDQFRTDSEIVEQTEALAKFLLSWGFNHQPEDDSKNIRDSEHPFAQRAWAAACNIQEMLTQTDVENALAELDGEIDATPKPSPAVDARAAFIGWYMGYLLTDEMLAAHVWDNDHVIAQAWRAALAAQRVAK